MSEPKIRVAITGGGIAGATLMHALLKHPHLDVHIFESAPAFRESGMAIGIARNAFQALELIGSSARQCLERAGSVPHHGVKFMLAQGPDAGEMADEIDARKDGKRLTSIVHRAAFLKELLADVAAERMHASKKLAGALTLQDGSLKLEFEDGSTHDCDILVGADGIRSTVRKIILGENDKAASPVPSGWFHLISMKPYEQMQPILGEKFTSTDDPREWGWFGDKAFMMHNVLSEGKFIQFIATVRSDSQDANWFRMIDAADFKKYFETWPEHLQKALATIIGDEKELKLLCMFEHLPARTYVDGPICIMGDAAHATTPWQGSGGGISIEDALIMSSLLGRSRTPGDARIALQVYDEARRPRTQQVVESSRNTGLIFSNCNPDYRQDLASLKGRLPPRWDFILDFDNGKARDEALRILESRLSSS